jgi:hypothetical protein
MIYESQGLSIDLSRLTRLYPAVIIKVAGDETQVSLEWAELKADVVSIRHYILVFDVDPLGDIPKNRVILYYENRHELDCAMQEVAQILKY